MASLAPERTIRSGRSAFGRRVVDIVRDGFEAQAERWLLWSPIFMGAGAASYLVLRFEPGWTLALAPLGVAWGLAAVARRLNARNAVRVAFAFLIFAAIGFTAAKVRTAMVAGPIATETEAVRILGRVVDVADPSETGSRVLIAPIRIGDQSGPLPKLIRITSPGFPYGPGAGIAFTGLVNPPPGPASPGGYDFARGAFFNGIGGSGVALTEPVIVSLPKPGWALGLRIQLNALRWSLAQKIAADMTPSAAGLGVAMVTGYEAWITPEVEQDLRDSGLAHIVSISGLHMAIVGGFAFFIMRLAIAAWPWLALRAPGKKIAAVFGLIAVATYLLISGAPAPAIRAAITTGTAFVAILADRKAITLRSLAIAALIILFLQPESVAEPGFQMSFSATAALVALAELWTGRPKEINTPWPIRIVQGFGFWLGVSLVASFVAGLATGPFSIQHFNRMAVFGLPANLAAEPISSFVMMPALAIGAVLEPVGLGEWPLKVASWAIEVLQGGAHWFSTRQGSVITVESAPAIALPIAFFGIVYMCLWKGKGRWIGLPLALAISWWPRPEAPVMWVDNEGAQAAVRIGKTAVLARPETRLFGAEYWTRRYALNVADEDREAVFTCSGSGCFSSSDTYHSPTIWWTKRSPSADWLQAACRSPSLVVTRNSAVSCPGVTTLGPDDFKKGGALEVFADGRLRWAATSRGRRPWVSGSDG